MRPALRAAALGLALLLAAAGSGEEAAPSPWALPEEGSCAPRGGLRGWPLGEDAPPVPFEPGQVLDLERLPLLRSYLPEEFWNQRDKFFHEGMRLEIGSCFRDYSPPAFFAEATRRLAGRARLADDGGLAEYVAGLPFPPQDIAPGDARAGLRWAWNVEFRYQAAGFRARFRIMDMVGRSHRAEPFEGELFKALVSFRSDRPEHGYKAADARSNHFVAGGRFFMPFNAREFSWRQYRNVAHLGEARRSDDLHAYLPQWRRVRRIPAVGVEGLYMPSFSVGVTPATQLAVGPGAAGAAGLAGGSVGGGGIGVAGADAAGVTAIKPKRTGFEGLALRPLLYSFRLLGLHDVLAPLNAAGPYYPADPDRGFGPWGLSFASDRWDLRRALVLEATPHEIGSESDASRIVLYVDLQTLQPLYYLSYGRSGEVIDVGYYVGRFSEDRADYPRWPDDPARPVRVIDPAGAAFANVRDQGGWRRESWEAVSTPPDEQALRKLLSVTELTKRR